MEIKLTKFTTVNYSEWKEQSDLTSINTLRGCLTAPGSALCAFIADFVRQEIVFIHTHSLFQPSSIMFHHKIPFLNIIPAEERQFIMECIETTRSFIDEEIPVADRNSVSYLLDFHIHMMGCNLLVTQKFIPLETDSHGYAQRGLFVLTPSHNPSFGKLEVLHGNQKWTYDRDCQSFKEEEIQFLSKQEKIMLILSRSGLSIKEIARITHRSENTIKTQRQRAYDKLKANNQDEAITKMDNYSLWGSEQHSS